VLGLGVVGENELIRFRSSTGGFCRSYRVPNSTVSRRVSFQLSCAYPAIARSCQFTLVQGDTVTEFGIPRRKLAKPSPGDPLVVASVTPPAPKGWPVCAPEKT
jgi:hypothetical protein